MDKKFKGIIRKRKPDTNKGNYGHVFVLAGSVGLTGAAYLCSQAAMVSGAGLVTLGIPKSLNDIMEVKLTEVMTLPLQETDQRTLSASAFDEIMDFAKKSDCIAIGPGLSRNAQTQDLICRLIGSLEKELVLDADGVNSLIGKIESLKASKSRMVLTPHPGEMARLLNISINEVQAGRKKIACKFAKDYKVVLVLKGHQTVVASPTGQCYVNKTGNPGMATAGTGDILTGMIAGFIAQNIDPFSAAKIAVYLHGLAGDLAAKQKSQTALIASDVLNRLPDAIKKVAR